MKNQKEKIIFIAMLIIASTLISFYFDSQISNAFSLIRTASLDSFFLGLTFISSEIILFGILTALFLYYGKKKILPLWITMALAGVISFIVKFSIQRPRPFQLGIVSVLPSLEKASHLIWNFSFPSFHAMVIFCTIPIFVKQFPKFKYVWITLAVLVGLSRVYFGVHFLSDVIVGASVGYLIGWLVLRKIGK